MKKSNIIIPLICTYILHTVNDAAWPSTSTLHSSEFNLAAHAHIWTNATCGADGPETYCRLAQHVHQRLSEQIQCGVCDDQSPDPDERHPIQNAIDGTNSWWQSPTMTHGKEYNWVTVTLDLKQVSIRGLFGCNVTLMTMSFYSSYDYRYQLDSFEFNFHFPIMFNIVYKLLLFQRQ